MESFVRLELSFLSQPQLALSASLITADGDQIVKSNFEGFNCPNEWIATFEGVAAAVKDAHSADNSVATSPVNGNTLGLSWASPVAAKSSTLKVSPLNRHARRRSVEVTRARRRDTASPRTPTNNAHPLALAPNPEVDDADRSTPSSPNVLPGPSSRPLVPGSGTFFATNATPVSPLAADHTYMDVVPPETRPIGESSLSQVELAGLSRIEAPHTSHIDSPTTSPKAVSALDKRANKLNECLKEIEQGYPPDKDGFNDTVRQLYNEECRVAPTQAVTSMEQVGSTLGQLGNISSKVGIIYSLLSWEVFRWEEERLVLVEGQSSIVAAKRINDKMVEVSSRRAKSNDWASDGRKAAGMVFGSIADLSIVAKSFALLILAGNVTLDGLLKIAHFPATRERFRTSFSNIVTARQEDWERLAANGYMIFNYKEFLLSRIRSRNIAPAVSISGHVSDRRIVLAADTPSSMARSSMLDCHIPSPVDAQSEHDWPGQHTQLSASAAGLQVVNDISMTGLDFDYNLCDDFSADELLQLSNGNLETGTVEFNSWNDF